MKNRFLGIVCLLYTVIITYVWVFDKLKNFLAPQMQIYLKLSVFPLLLMSLILLFNRNSHYRFKWTDLILLLPIIMIIISSDGRLTESLAQNRMANYKENKVENKEKKKEKKETEEITEEKEETIEKVSEDAEIYFDINDENYQDLANYLTFAPKSDKFAGKTIKVKGFINKSQQYIPSGYFAIGKYSITCCAADAGFVGFIVKDNNLNLKENTWYEIEGTLTKSKDVAGYDILTITPKNIKNIDGSKEKQYVYPCYNYGDGKCKEMKKYDLAY